MLDQKSVRHGVAIFTGVLGNSFLAREDNYTKAQLVCSTGKTQKVAVPLFWRDERGNGSSYIAFQSRQAKACDKFKRTTALRYVIRRLLMKFAGVCLIAENAKSLADFYQALFDMDGVWEGDDHVDFPGMGLAIFSIGGMEEMAPGSTKGTGSGRTFLSYDVPEVDVLAYRLLDLGAEIVKQPQSHPWGARSVWVKDPEGNLLSLHCPAN